MAVSKIHNETIELLLKSITSQMGDDGMLSSFLYQRPADQPWGPEAGTEIFYHFTELRLATLYVRSNGPQYLKSLPLQEISSKLQKFLTANYWYISNTVFDFRDDRSFDLRVSPAEKSLLANALSSDPIFTAEDYLTVFPLFPIQVAPNMDFEEFFFSCSKSENAFFLGDDARFGNIDPTTFPPQRDTTGKKSTPSSWLGVRSPDYRAALKARSSILGATVLTQLPQYRHMFSMRKISGGRFSIDGQGTTMSFDKLHTPPCMQDILLTEADRDWLRIVSDKLGSSDPTDIRHLKALEYFYRAWPLSPEERFPIYCMAMDAIFGEANNSTAAVVDGVRGLLGEHINDKRLRSIYDLRASVIHGGAPDVYDSSKYPKYYRKYGADPLTDYELVVGACLRSKVFDGVLVEHADPNAEIIRQARELGRIPPARPVRDILSAAIS